MPNITPFPIQRGGAIQTGFDRIELMRIMDLYGRMVSAGHWRDYAIDMGRDAAVFSAFRRATERPEYRIENLPALRPPQGLSALMGDAGGGRKGRRELFGVIATGERKHRKIVGEKENSGGGKEGISRGAKRGE